MSVVFLGSGTGTGVNNPHFTLGQAIPAGALLVGVAFCSSGTISSMGDGTNSLGSAVSLTDAATAVLAIWYKQNTSAVASGTFTVTLSSTPTASNILAFYIDNGLTSGALDVTASHDSGTAATVDTGTTATTAQAVEIAIAAYYGGFSRSSGHNLGAGGSGYTAFSEVDQTDGSNTQYALLASYKVLAATGTQSATTTPDTSASQGDGVVATFKLAAVDAYPLGYYAGQQPSPTVLRL